MKRLVLALVIMMSSMVVIGFGGVQEPKATPPTQMPQMGQMGMGMMNCPMNVKGAEIVATNTKDGISLTLTTTSGDVGDLRKRVESMAKMHSAASTGPMMGERMIPFTAQYEEIPQGARLTLTPKDPARLEEFRDMVRKHAERMKSGDCSMMQDMMKGMMGGMKTPEAPKPESNPNDVDHSKHHPEEAK